jgi:hypothetical protein
MARRVRPPSELADFAKLHPEVEGVIQHVGRETWDLLLVDVNGLWVREEFPSLEAAEAACEQLGVRSHRGWGDPRMSRRFAARDHWATPDGQRRAT